VTSKKPIEVIRRPSKRERRELARTQRTEQQERLLRRRRAQRRARLFALVSAVILVLGLVGTFITSSLTSSTTTTTSSTTSTTSTTTTTTTTIPKARAAALQASANQVARAAGCPASTKTRVNTLSWKTAPPLTINIELPYYAHVVTTAGTFVVQLDAKAAPVTTNNFIFLSDHDFYHCSIFHRVIPGFIIQGGDPTGTGQGGPGYTIPDEYPLTGTPTYPLYSVAMANTGAPHTGSSQFFIVTGPEGEALPNKYSLFGLVVRGQSVIKTINQEGNPSSDGQPPIVTQRILSVTITHTV
jgi:cyclophilin family peptidyl-prolyl cis-trans isomerase